MSNAVRRDLRPSCLDVPTSWHGAGVVCQDTVVLAVITASAELKGYTCVSFGDIMDMRLCWQDLRLGHIWSPILPVCLQ